MPPVDEAQRFRDRAKDMRDMAKKARSERVKEELLVIAQQYDKLADERERMDRQRNHR